MTRTTFPGGLYIDAYPSGEYVVLFPGSHFQTHLGTVPFPAGEAYGLMFVSCTTVDGFKFAGLAHDSNRRMWEWSERGGWMELPFIWGRGVYDAFGVYQDAAPNGYRFCDDKGVLRTNGETYGPLHNLSEWSETDGLQIGQTHTGTEGVKVWDGQLRVLEDGRCTFIKVHRQGERVAVSFAKPGEAVMIQTTVSELRALPVYVPDLGTIPPDPGTPVEPPKEPDVEYRLPDPVKQIRDAYVARFPVPQMDGLGPADDPFENICRAWIKALAEQIVFETGDSSWGVKNAGGGRPQSKDSLAHQDGERLINFDLLVGVGTGHPSLVADPQGDDITGQVFMPVSGVNHLGTAPPDPPQPPTQPPTDDLLPIILSLERDVAGLQKALQKLVVDTSEIQDIANGAATVAARALEAVSQPVSLDGLRAKGTIALKFATRLDADLPVVRG